MHTFFDEKGLLNIDEAVMKIASFRKIMEDGIVTEEEIYSQATRVTGLLNTLEESCSPAQAKMIKELIAEMSVLFSVYHYRELQKLK